MDFKIQSWNWLWSTASPGTFLEVRNRAEARAELLRRLSDGGLRCNHCGGGGYLKDATPLGDEICSDCDGTGTVYPQGSV